MFVKKIAGVVAAFAVAAAPVHVLAWGYVGHKVVAAVAWQYMTPAAREHVQALLAQDMDTLTPTDFVSRATWADAYRNGHKETSAWHYIDIPYAAADSLEHALAAEPAQCPHPTLPGQSAALGAPEADCIVDKIRQFEAELRDPATPVAEQILALKFLMHFVGDVHQPLHAIDDDDKGGNCVWISTGDKPQRLHAYWDTGAVLRLLGDRTAEAYATDEKAEIDKTNLIAQAGGDPAQWAAESAVLARSYTYNLGVQTLPTCATENTAAPIDVSHTLDPKPIVRNRLDLAGVRLAYVLNDIFK